LNSAKNSKPYCFWYL